jgi:FkbM family methyltransferase
MRSERLEEMPGWGKKIFHAVLRRIIPERSILGHRVVKITRGGVRYLVPVDSGLGQRLIDDLEIERRKSVEDPTDGGGGVLLDIGANIGTYCLPLAISKRFDRIYAFEPEPLNFECLRRSIRLNGLEDRVFPDCRAITSYDGMARLELKPSIGGHRVQSREFLANPKGKSKHRPTIDVECSALDSWVRARGIALEDLRLIKVDTQGSEGHVLRGAAGILALRKATWQIEYWPAGLRSNRFDVEELHQILAGSFREFRDVGKSSRDRDAKPISSLPDHANAACGEKGHTDLILVP